MAKFNVKVIPNAKQNKLVEEPGRLKVYLTAPAVEGKANMALIEFLAEHFKLKKNNIANRYGISCLNLFNTKFTFNSTFRNYSLPKHNLIATAGRFNNNSFFQMN